MSTYIEYRSFEDMNEAILTNLQKFPHNAEVVVGIPRSGMLPASLVALYLNKPLTDIDSFINGHIYTTGNRGKSIISKQSGPIIVIDDTISSGKAMNAAKTKLSAVTQDKNFFYAAVFASSVGIKYVDLYCNIINGPRIFQWNLFHDCNLMAKACMDIDGVLCPNPPEDDDGVKYMDYITHAEPYIIPTVEINTLVSCRLEKYRNVTETWLHKNGVKYSNLIMLDLPTKEARLKWGQHGDYKGRVYKKTKCILFIESSKEEAIKICNESRKQVFCVDTQEMLYGGHVYMSRASTKSISYVKRIGKKILSQKLQLWIKQTFINR